MMRALLSRPAVRELTLRGAVLVAAWKFYDLVHASAAQRVRDELAAERAYLAAAEVHLAAHPAPVDVVDRVEAAAPMTDDGVL